MLFQEITSKFELNHIRMLRIFIATLICLSEHILYLKLYMCVIVLYFSEISPCAPCEQVFAHFFTIISPELLKVMLFSHFKYRLKGGRNDSSVPIAQLKALSAIFKSPFFIFH